MADLLFIGILTVFFGVCVLFIKACDRMIEHSDTGAADVSGTGDSDDSDVEAELEVVA